MLINLLAPKRKVPVGTLLSPFKVIFISIFFFISTLSYSQTDSLKVVVADTIKKETEKKAEPKKEDKKWYESLSIRGYTHFRYNGLFNTNPNLGCEQCDRFWGDKQGLSIRRARLTVYGFVTDKVYVYIQTDLANIINAQSFLNFLQIRDLYTDIYFNKPKTLRLRVGLSKVPFGFDNMQSSQNRLAIDRSDAINSASPNERDMGLFLYYTPKKIRDRFKELQNAQMKGSGDYGVLALGIYNGQSMNKPEQNNNFHMVARADYPFKLKNGQYVEAGLQAYSGKFVVPSDKRTASVIGNSLYQYWDQRAGVNLVVYPQPFGFQAEYNLGTGPSYNPTTKRIQSMHLEGGYAQVCYKVKAFNMLFYPYTRSQYYKGAKKHETDARYYLVKEQEVGIEWQPNKALELTAAYFFSDRTYEDFAKQVNRQKGSVLRLQLQVNY